MIHSSTNVRSSVRALTNELLLRQGEQTEQHSTTPLGNTTPLGLVSPTEAVRWQADVAVSKPTIDDHDQRTIGEVDVMVM